MYNRENTWKLSQYWHWEWWTKLVFLWRFKTEGVCNVAIQVLWNTNSWYVYVSVYLPTYMLVISWLLNFLKAHMLLSISSNPLCVEMFKNDMNIYVFIYNCILHHLIELGAHKLWICTDLTNPIYSICNILSATGLVMFLFSLSYEACP